MNTAEQHIIYTIGHSTHTTDEFVAMLHSFGVRELVDIRSLPGSRKFPRFDRENLEAVLPANGIGYTYMKDLGGRRKAGKDSKNIRWRNPSFRGYADYMETVGFKKAVAELEETATHKVTAYMCAEAVWWRCHRALVSDYLKARGWKVIHIMGIGKAKEHTYTSPANVSGIHVSYED